MDILAKAKISLFLRNTYVLLKISFRKSSILRTTKAFSLWKPDPYWGERKPQGFSHRAYSELGGGM